MFKKIVYISMAAAFTAVIFTGCKAPALSGRKANTSLPAGYNTSNDTVNIASLTWKKYFTDLYLDSLIDTALQNNQELNITMQEIEIARNEIRIRKGEYLPFVGLKAGAGVEKVGRYTSQGANDANTEIRPGEEFPEPLPDFMVGAYASWEVDVWGKLRNAKKAAVTRYLSTVEGRKLYGN
jgi:multidrug efflux system outer membrane protein